VVQLLMADGRIGVNKADADGCTPFFKACEQGHLNLVILFLAHPAVDINQPAHDHCSPLWFASQEGHLNIVQLMLVSGRKVKTQVQSTPGTALWNGLTAAEIARKQSMRSQLQSESPEDYARKMRNCPRIAKLLEDFHKNPKTTRQRLREQPGIREPFIAEVFSLVVFVSDGFFALKKARKRYAKAVRFFAMAKVLPMELQMVLCNRVFASLNDLVLTKDSEPAFRKLGKQA